MHNTRPNRSIDSSVSAPPVEDMKDFEDLRLPFGDERFAKWRTTALQMNRRQKSHTGTERIYLCVAFCVRFRRVAEAVKKYHGHI